MKSCGQLVDNPVDALWITIRNLWISCGRKPLSPNGFGTIEVVHNGVTPLAQSPVRQRHALIGVTPLMTQPLDLNLLRDAVLEAATAYRRAHKPFSAEKVADARVALFAAVDALPSTSDVPPETVGENRDAALSASRPNQPMKEA